MAKGPYDEPAFVRLDFGRERGYLESIAEIQWRTEHGGPMPRPRIYNGVTFRSTLEAKYAFHLDTMGDEWVYEPHVFGPRGRGYLPDFQIINASRPTFIEVKPTIAEAPAAQRKMSVIWETLPDALLIVACQEMGANFSAYRGDEWRRWPEKWSA